MVDFPLSVTDWTTRLSDAASVFQPDKRFDWDIFPQDLSSEQIGNYMIIRVYTQSGAIAAPTGTLGNAFAAGVGATAGTISNALNAVAQGLGYIPPFNFTNNAPLARYDQNNYNVALFMPSEEGGGLFPSFTDTHEYAEISMSNVILNQIPAAASGALRGAVGATGRAINPGVQVLYRSTHLRNFDFSFLFAPRSQRESVAMENIIKKLRMYSSPVDEGLFYRSPAEIVIEFHRRIDNSVGGINYHVIRMKRQTVRQIDVNYAPSGVYSTFKNGYPVHCMMTLRTKEMEIITRNAVEEGF